MTQEERYTVILNSLAEALAEKDRTINYKDWRIAELEEKLKAAEATLDSQKKEVENK